MRTILFFRNLTAFCRDFDAISAALESATRTIEREGKFA